MLWRKIYQGLRIGNKREMFKKVVRDFYTEKVTFEQRSEGNDRASQDRSRKNFPGRGNDRCKILRQDCISLHEDE